MIKTLKLFIIIVGVSLLSSCGIINDLKDSEDELQYTLSQMDKIIMCFDNKDAEGLKLMFCPKKQADPTLEEQILNAYELYEGKSISYSYTRTSMAGGGTDDYKWVDKHYRPLIDNIQTDEGKEYSISYFEYLIYDADPSEIGITYVNLVDSENNLLARII